MHKYDVAISFAGEDRRVAAEIASTLDSSGVRVFYDDYEKADLWGKDLYEYLADVYANHARYCVMLLSENYERKLWTNHERKNAQARAFRECEEYILPVKLDDTEIPGIRPTVGYVDLRSTTIPELVQMVLAKLQRAVPIKAEPEKDTAVAAVDFDIPIPRVKKTFTQLDKDRFLKTGFSFIMNYFKQGIEKVTRAGNGLEGDFTEVGSLKFVAKIYHNGNVIAQCKIWMGGAFSQEQICYSESFHDIHNDNSMNDWLSVKSNENLLYFEPSGMGRTFGHADAKNLNEKEAAEYFWRRFTARMS